MAKCNSIRTSKRIASKASDLMRNSKSAATRKVAASALANKKKSNKK